MYENAIIMQIRKGVVYYNKTWKFLLPSLKGHGNELATRLVKIFKLGVGVYDTITGDKYDNQKLIFMLCDRDHDYDEFYKFLGWVAGQPYFVDSYCASPDIKGNEFMVVLKIPTIFESTYDAFVKGEYSNMYPGELLDQMNFLQLHKAEEEKIPFKIEVHEIITKNPNQKTIFLDKLENEFVLKGGLGMQLSDITDDMELELPLKPEEEIFNFQPIIKDNEHEIHYMNNNK